ncbi:substrate-binding periplasmic protein [Desulfosediminicola flagellatus]|uniref:substrate-binding periplasmic protein n=1 Tax=Desulfosediminicola flagellatus TaxID=2569541 RepID=UPI00142EAD89|nr:ABC transporter substrate-binding protein [Desulfosediminicola flagellatus]
MKKVNVFLSILAFVLMSYSGAAFAEDFKIMTEEFPPFNYTQDGKLTGLSSEVMVELTKRVGHQMNAEVLPWARAYGLIQRKDGLILYSMTRTEAREELFKWVGPIASNKWVFFTKKGSGIVINSLEDAKKVKAIGAYKEDAAETFLKEQGFTNIDSVPNDELNVPKLMGGRIDLWIVGELQGIHKAKQKGESDNLEKVFDVKDTQLYIAFSKNTPDEVITTWQSALDAIKADGTYDAIVKKYM